MIGNKDLPQSRSDSVSWEQAVIILGVSFLADVVISHDVEMALKILALTIEEGFSLLLVLHIAKLRSKIRDVNIEN